MKRILLIPILIVVALSGCVEKELNVMDLSAILVNSGENLNKEMREMGARMKTILGLFSSPVGVRFLKAEEVVEGAKVLDRHRYCQALMRARHS